MNIEYYRAYENLYADYVYEERHPFRPYFPYEYDLIRTIRRAIDRNSDPLENFRSDARYFLLVNFHQMIIRPLLEVRPYSNPILDPIDFFQAINDDVGTVIQNARENASYGGEITGHSMMQSINNLWPQLRTTKFEIWG